MCVCVCVWLYTCVEGGFISFSSTKLQNRFQSPARYCRVILSSDIVEWRQQRSGHATGKASGAAGAGRLVQAETKLEYRLTEFGFIFFKSCKTKEEGRECGCGREGRL